MTEAEAQWHRDMAGELEFWRRWAKEHRGLAIKRGSPTAPLLPWVDDAVTRVSCDPVRILEVGTGLFSAMGRRTRSNRLVKITCTDPLAEKFPAILDEHSLTRSYPIVRAEAERVCEHFGAESFDVVYAQNALDHCWDVLRALREIASVLRPGGRLVLRHMYRCGSRNNWQGLHKWDFFVARGKLVVEGLYGPASRHYVHGVAPLETEDLALDLHPSPGASEAWLTARLVRR